MPLAKSEKTVQSYQNHRDRVAQFASNVSTAWGNMNLKQADAQLDREAKIKQEGDKRAIDDADSYFKLAKGYLEEGKKVSDEHALASKDYGTGTLGAAKTHGEDATRESATYLNSVLDDAKVFQVAVSLAYTIWKNSEAAIKRDKILRDAAAELDYRLADAGVRATVEPDYAVARRDLAIASAKFNANEIGASQWQQAQTTYANAIQAANQRLAQLLEQPGLTRRTAEGEAIRLREIETATAEQTWIKSSTTAYLTWVKDSGNEGKITAGHMENAGVIFVSAETGKASTANEKVANSSKDYEAKTSTKEATLLQELVDHANAFALELVKALGGWLFGKVDARAEYEAELAESHKQKKEELHQSSPNSLTALQRSIATADATKYQQRRTGKQQRSTDWKNDAVQLTQDLNAADEAFVDGTTAADTTAVGDSATASANAAIGSGTAVTSLRYDGTVADLERITGDVIVAANTRYSMAQADVAHAERIQTAKVVQATTVGDALKKLHIDQYTEAAKAEAETAKANAQATFKSSAKLSRITLAEQVGDAAISAATASGTHLQTQVNSWNTAFGTYTTSSNTNASNYTLAMNGVALPWIEDSEDAESKIAVDTADAHRDALKESGDADVALTSTLANADAARSGAEASAQAAWVTSEVQNGNSTLLWSQENSAASTASGAWASQYASIRTAMLAATSLIDAARQVAGQVEGSDRNNKQADADVKFLEDIANPVETHATETTQADNSTATDRTTKSNSTRTALNDSRTDLANGSRIIESKAALDRAKAWKGYQVALAGLDEGADTAAIEKDYQDELALVTHYVRVEYAELGYQEGISQIGTIADTFAAFAQYDKAYVDETAAAEKKFTDAAAPIIGERTVQYAKAEKDKLVAGTAADNAWRNDTALAWANHTAGDLNARGNAQRGVASASSVLADQARAAIAETKAQWWQGHIPSYLQWSTDIGAQEATYTAATTDHSVQRATLIKNAGVAYADDVATALKTFETATVGARSSYLVTVMPFYLTAADKTSKAHRDLEMDMADAELNKQLTGNNSDYEQAVEDANTRHTNTVTQANEELENALKPERKKRDDLVTAATKDKEAAIAKEEREYQEAIAAIDAQYGSESAGGDTGTEGATRRAAIATRDAQYYADRDTSWANTLSGSTTLGTSPWSVKAISDASAQAAFSTSRASAQAAHDAAMLDAVEDWQLSSRDSLTDLLFAEGHSRETFSVATANVYADWENGVGNLLAGKPEGTEWSVGENGSRSSGANPLAAGWLGRAFWGGEETDGAAGNQGNSNLKTDKIPNPKDARKLTPPNANGDEDEVKKLEIYLKAFYGENAMILLEAFRASGAKVRFAGHWDWGLWLQGGSDLEGNWYNPNIVIDATLSPPERAEQLMRQLIEASGYSGVRARLGFGIDISEEDLARYKASNAQGFNNAVPIVQGIAKAYYEGIAFVSIGADIVVTTNELYEHQNPWALIGLLPLIPSNIRSASGNLVVRAGNDITVKISESISGILSRLSKSELEELTGRLATAQTDKEAQRILEQFAKLADNAPKETVWANGVTGLADDLSKFAHNIEPKAGFTDVFIHSTADSFHVLHNGSWVKLSHRDVANYLGSKGISGNLRLISCDAGQAQLAQNLANKLGVTVEAATTKVGVPTNFISDPLLELGGKWLQFLPGGK